MRVSQVAFISCVRLSNKSWFLFYNSHLISPFFCGVKKEGIAKILLFNYWKNISSTINKSQTQDILLCIIIMKPIFIFTQMRHEVLYVLVLLLILAEDGAVERALREKCCSLVKLFLHSCAHLFHVYSLIEAKEIARSELEETGFGNIEDRNIGLLKIERGKLYIYIYMILYTIYEWIEYVMCIYTYTPTERKKRYRWFIVVQLLSHVWLFATPWTAAHQASLSFIISRSLLKLMSIELVILSNHLILCCPLLLPSIFPRIRVFSNELALCIRWPKYWSFRSFQWIFRVDFL